MQWNADQPERILLMVKLGPFQPIVIHAKTDFLGAYWHHPTCIGSDPGAAQLRNQLFN